MHHSKNSILKQASIKTLTEADLYQRKGFNGVRELQSLFGTHSCDKPTHFSLCDNQQEADGLLSWVATASAASIKYRLSFTSNEVLLRAEPGDNIVIGIDLSGIFHCIIYKSGKAGYQGRMTNWTRYC
ncbi:hypothetical protein TUM12370_32410 [Salmonella enterica subsp. enterica serovar Choleraesuis]|nr:hypothetical protein TUM12370_32410 [Salmonella enterica subsp. enterica serovar Choleraesuis]